MEDLYIALIKQVEEQGALSPYNRQLLWKMLEEEENASIAEGKYITLELNSIQKVIDSWVEEAPICTKIQELYQRIVQLFHSDNKLLEKVVSEFYEECDLCIEKGTSFYEVYLKQSIVYLMDVVEGVEGIPQDELYDTSVKNRELENDERDTAYCTCMMYSFNNLAVSDNERKRREMEFWDWYIKEAAKLQGIIIQATVKIPKKLLEETKIEINSIEEFVKYISYEYDYDKYEVVEGKRLLVHVFNYKNSAPCPKCGQYSNHIFTQQYAITFDILGELNGWTVAFRVCENAYYCDNPDCYDHFYIESKVWFEDKQMHFLKLRSIYGMPEKICTLFGINESKFLINMQSKK